MTDNKERDEDAKTHAFRWSKPPLGEFEQTALRDAFCKGWDAKAARDKAVAETLSWYKAEAKILADNFLASDKKLALAVEALKNYKCTCVYKPFTHQYFFKCEKCKAIAAIGEVK